jgi:hypothetical protein
MAFPGLLNEKTFNFVSILIYLLLIICGFFILYYRIFFYRKVRKSTVHEKKEDLLVQSIRHNFTVNDLAICKGDLIAPIAYNPQGFSSHQILICANGEVYEATSHPTGRNFYAPESPYRIFAGVDSTVALGKAEISSMYCNNFSLIPELTEEEQKAVADYLKRFRKKYKYVGNLSELQNKQLNLTRFDCPPL